MTLDETSRLREQIDLLVDGELEEPDRKALLLNLDTMPNGWKQCALAFLEAQMFKLSLRQWQDRITPVQPKAMIASTVPKRPPLRRLPMTLVASLLAFVGGSCAFRLFTQTAARTHVAPVA